jgi:flagellar secretion chaperone FliS
LRGAGRYQGYRDNMEQLVSSYARNPALAAYRSVVAYGGVAQADPHALVMMLMDAAIERMRSALGCMECGEIGRKAQLLHSCVTLVAELRGSLNLTAGGDLARNLDGLYEYMTRRLLLANAGNDPRCVREVLALLTEIRSGWAAIGPQVREAHGAAAPAAPAVRGVCA